MTMKNIYRKDKRVWCIKCDATLIHDGEKCINCGAKQKRRKNKKQKGRDNLIYKEYYY